MFTEEKIALNCPYCSEVIYESLSWFKKTYSTCPTCDKGLAVSQFSAAVADIEQALDDSIEEMVNGKPSSGCCGSGGCGAHKE